MPLFHFLFYIKNVGPLYLSKCFWVAEETMSEKGNFFFLPQKKVGLVQLVYQIFLVKQENNLSG